MYQLRSQLLFGSLYFCQGGLSSYISYFQKPYLVQRGVSLSELGLLTTIISLPFSFKLILGIVTDRFSFGKYGHRLPWIIGGVLCSAAAFIGAAMSDPAERLRLYTVLIFGMVASIALADTALQALAVETTPPEGRAGVQAAMTGGRACGAVAASAIAAILINTIGFNGMMSAMALMVVTPLPFVVWFAPRSHGDVREFPIVQTFKRFFNRPRIVFILYALIMSVGLSGTIGLITLFLHSQFQVGIAVIGRYAAMVSIGTFVGATIYAFGRRLFSVTIAIAVGQIGLIGVALTLAVVTAVPNVAILGLVVGLSYGSVVTGVLEMAMARSDVRFAGTSFALLLTVFDVGGSIGDGVATAASGWIGFDATFCGLAIMSAASLPLVSLSQWLHRPSLSQNPRAYN